MLGSELVYVVNWILPVPDVIVKRIIVSVVMVIGVANVSETLEIGVDDESEMELDVAVKLGEIFRFII